MGSAAASAAVLRALAPNSEPAALCRVAREGAAHCARGGRAPLNYCIIPTKNSISHHKLKRIGPELIAQLNERHLCA